MEAGRFAEIFGALGEFGRRQVAGRGVHEIPGSRDRGGDRLRPGGRDSGGRLRVRRKDDDLAQLRILGSGLFTAEAGESVGAQDQPLDRRLEVQIRQGGVDGLDAAQRPRSHPGRPADRLGRPLVARLAQSDGQHAVERQGGRHHPGQLLGAALGAQCLQRYFDLTDGLGVEIGVGDHGGHGARVSCI